MTININGMASVLSQLQMNQFKKLDTWQQEGIQIEAVSLLES